MSVYYLTKNFSIIDLPWCLTIDEDFISSFFYKMKKTLGSFYYYNCRRLHTNPQILQVVDNRYHMVTKWILTPNFSNVALQKNLG